MTPQSSGSSTSNVLLVPSGDAALASHHPDPVAVLEASPGTEGRTGPEAVTTLSTNLNSTTSSTTLTSPIDAVSRARQTARQTFSVDDVLEPTNFGEQIEEPFLRLREEAKLKLQDLYKEADSVCEEVKAWMLSRAQSEGERAAQTALDRYDRVREVERKHIDLHRHFIATRGNLRKVVEDFNDGSKAESAE